MFASGTSIDGASLVPPYSLAVSEDDHVTAMVACVDPSVAIFGAPLSCHPSSGSFTGHVYVSECVLN